MVPSKVGTRPVQVWSKLLPNPEVHLLSSSSPPSFLIPIPFNARSPPTATMTAEADGAPPPLLQVLDSHIHLWPSSHLSPTHHGWMTPGHQLARRHGLTDYAAAVCASSPTVQQQQNQRQPHLLGVVYVETDRYLPSVWPRSKSSNEDNIQAPGAVIDSGSNGITRQRSRTLLEDWAKGPLDELRFLRRIVEGNADADVDGGSSDRDGPPLLALVVWAPLHLNPDLIKLYLEIAEEVAGEKTWARIAGFRYLIQGIRQEEEMKNLVESPDWLDNLRSLSQGRGGRGWSFDVGVDVRSGGVWQVEVAADMVGKVRERERKSGEGAGSSVRFILSKSKFFFLSWN